LQSNEIDNAGGEAILKQMAKRKLVKLELDNNKITGAVLTEYLKYMPLRKLHLVKNQLTFDQAKTLNVSLKQSRDLDSVFMTHNNMSDEALGLMADAFACNDKIEEISITHNDLSLPNGKKLVDSFKMMPNLLRLSLNSCKITEELLESLAVALESNVKLTDLNLYSNDIHTDSAPIVARIIKDKTSLRTLGLSNNCIGFGGAREIASTC
jgi:Ran GTPase-activating protein (RanGAP) involved in mRNA processing and transport